jgi:hypothetical protein
MPNRSQGNRGQTTAKTKPVQNPKWDKTNIKQELKQLVQNHNWDETNAKPYLRLKRKYNGGEFEHAERDDREEERIWTRDHMREEICKARQMNETTVEIFKTQKKLV